MDMNQPEWWKIRLTRMSLKSVQTTRRRSIKQLRLKTKPRGRPFQRPTWIKKLTHLTLKHAILQEWSLVVPGNNHSLLTSRTIYWHRCLLRKWIHSLDRRPGVPFDGLSLDRNDSIRLHCIFYIIIYSVFWRRRERLEKMSHFFRYRDSCTPAQIVSLARILSFLLVFNSWL